MGYILQITTHCLWVLIPIVSYQIFAPQSSSQMATTILTTLRDSLASDVILKLLNI